MELRHDPRGGPTHDIDTTLITSSSSSSVTSVRTTRWWGYQDTTPALWIGRGYLVCSSYTLVNPVQILNLDHLGRVTEVIQATRSNTSGELSASDSFAQSS